MNPKFIDWLADMRPSQWCMYGNAYRAEAVHLAREDIDNVCEHEQFEAWLLDCFNREYGEKIQGEDNE